MALLYAIIDAVNNTGQIQTNIRLHVPLLCSLQKVCRYPGVVPIRFARDLNLIISSPTISCLQYIEYIDYLLMVKITGCGVKSLI